jgi:hypothetical protein
MNWYLAKLVFSIKHETKNTPTQFDEQLRLLQAKDKLEALLKAKMIGIKEENTFKNENEMEVRWDFVDVIELNTIDSFTDGMELSSRIDEHEAIEHYTAYVKHRGQLLISDVQHSTQQVSV